VQEMVNHLHKTLRNDISLFSVKRFIKHTYQYWTRGFSDKELWNLDKTIAQHIASNPNDRYDTLISLMKIYPIIMFDYLDELTEPLYELLNKHKLEFLHYKDFIEPRLKVFVEYTDSHHPNFTFEEWKTELSSLVPLNENNLSKFIEYFNYLWD